MKRRQTRRLAELQSRLQLGDPTLAEFVLYKGRSFRRLVHLVGVDTNALCSGVPMHKEAHRILAPLAVMLEHNGTCRRLCRECIEALP